MDGVVTIDAGRIRGVHRNGVWAFSGIPYAQPPVGELRWRAPLPPSRWENILDASTFGPIAPQPASSEGIMTPSDPAAPEFQSEDCLTLNVWTPSLPGESTTDPASGRPVMVWIHGGGFTTGSGSVFLYRGGPLVRNGDVVVVTINYRLGALGFLGHRSLADVDGRLGNWGLQDQIAALQWVRDNIGAFGGDPSNVTVFGESAGAMSVSALLGTPAAVSLFRRAIVESGPVHVHSIDEADQRAIRLAEALGLSSLSRAALMKIPADELVAATEVVAKYPPDPGLIPLPFLPVVDGSFLTRHPLENIADGLSADVDLIIGTNRDELTLWGLSNPSLWSMDEAAMTRWIARAAPDIPPGELLEAYRQSRITRSEGVEPRDLWVSVGSDGVFRWPSLRLAAAHRAPTFVYLFEWESPAFGGMLGSCHALEIPFVFGMVHVPAVQALTGNGAAADRLSNQMQQAWVSFARTGRPSHEGLGAWPEWNQGTRPTMIFGASSRVEERPRDQELSVWERYRPLTGGRET
jgi:para-nitrobenzyl esterase